MPVTRRTEAVDPDSLHLGEETEVAATKIKGEAGSGAAEKWMSRRDKSHLLLL